MMIAQRAIVLVMMDETKDERHTEVQQTYQRRCYPVLIHAESKFGGTMAESQARTTVFAPAVIGPNPISLPWRCS